MQLCNPVTVGNWRWDCWAVTGWGMTKIKLGIQADNDKAEHLTTSVDLYQTCLHVHPAHSHAYVHTHAYPVFKNAKLEL